MGRLKFGAGYFFYYSLETTSQDFAPFGCGSVSQKLHGQSPLIIHG